MNTANSYIGNSRAVAAAILKAKNDAYEEAIELVEQMAHGEGSDFGLIEEIRNLKHEG